MIKLTYSLSFGKWDLVLASETLCLGITGIEFGLGSPTLVNLTKFCWDLEDLKGVLPKSWWEWFSPCILDVVHIWFCLIVSLVIVHGLVTHVLAGLVMQMNHT